MTNLEIMLASLANPQTVIQLWRSLYSDGSWNSRKGQVTTYRSYRLHVTKEDNVLYIENGILWVVAEDLEGDRYTFYKGMHLLPDDLDLTGVVNEYSISPVAVIYRGILEIRDSLQWAEFYNALLTSARTNTYAGL